MYNPLLAGKSAQSGVGRDIPKWQPLKPLKPTELQSAGFVQQNFLSSKGNTFSLWTVEEQQAAKKLAQESLGEELAVTDFSAQSHEAFSDETQVTTGTSTGLDAEAIDKIKQEAYERGLSDGQQIQRDVEHAQAAQIEADSLIAFADKANQLLANIDIAIQSLQENPAAWNEPLKRLALHLAEQIALTELSLSSTGINNLIDRCIETLDVQTASSVVVELNPSDMALLQNHIPVPGEAKNSWRMVADANLLTGSVRVRADDAVVSDLVEHRLETLANKLLQNPKTWQAQSSFQPERLSARRGKADSVEDALPRESSPQYENTHTAEDFLPINETAEFTESAPIANSDTTTEPDLFELLKTQDTELENLEKVSESTSVTETLRPIDLSTLDLPDLDLDASKSSGDDDLSGATP